MTNHLKHLHVIFSIPLHGLSRHLHPLNCNFQLTWYSQICSKDKLVEIYQWNGFPGNERFECLLDKRVQNLVTVVRFLPSFQQQTVTTGDRQSCHLCTKQKIWTVREIDFHCSWESPCLWVSLCLRKRERKRDRQTHRQRSALTWGRQSGRDSKITRRTPIGVVTCFNSRPSASNVLLTTRPTMSELWSAICFRPS